MKDYKKQYWEHYAKTYQQVYELRHKYFLIPAITKFAGEVKNKSLIDIGCGAGQIANVLTKKGANVIGIDESSKMIEIAKKNYPNIKLICGDAVDLNNYVKQKFDIVLAVQFFLTISSRNKIKKIFNQVYD